MSLDTTQLAKDLIEVFSINATETDPENAVKKMSSSLASCLEKYIKTATVTFESGTVTGSTPSNGTLQNGEANNGKVS